MASGLAVVVNGGCDCGCDCGCVFRPGGSGGGGGKCLGVRAPIVEVEAVAEAERYEAGKEAEAEAAYAFFWSEQPEERILPL